MRLIKAVVSSSLCDGLCSPYVAGRIYNGDVYCSGDVELEVCHVSGDVIHGRRRCNYGGLDI